MNVEFIRKLSWNVLQYLKTIDRDNTTHFYGLILMGLDDPSDDEYPYNEDEGIKIMVVCNRYNWKEEIRLKMFNVRFLIFTTDLLDSIHYLRKGVVLDFSFELGKEDARFLPRH